MIAAKEGVTFAFLIRKVLTEKLKKDKTLKKNREKINAISALLSSHPEIQTWKENIIRKGSVEHDKILYK